MFEHEITANVLIFQSENMHVCKFDSSVVKNNKKPFNDSINLKLPPATILQFLQRCMFVQRQSLRENGQIGNRQS